MREGVSYWLRHLGAAALVVAGARFSAYEFEAWQSWEAEREAPTMSPTPAPPKQLDLEKLKGMEGSDLAEAEGGSSLPSLRRILVDWGPERSKVFVNGRYVGETPYGGQVACASGDFVAVVVLPPSGAPSSRSIRCHGMTMAVARAPAEAAPEASSRPPSKAASPNLLGAADPPSALQSPTGAELPLGGGTDGELSPETLEVLQRAIEQAQRDAESR